MAGAVGERIKKLRSSRKLTLRELAKLAEVPISTLSAIETGKRDGKNLTLETGRRLARALGTTLDYLSGVYEGEPSEAALEDRREGMPSRAVGAPHCERPLAMSVANT